MVRSPQCKSTSALGRGGRKDAWSLAIFCEGEAECVSEMTRKRVLTRPGCDEVGNVDMLVREGLMFEDERNEGWWGNC